MRESPLPTSGARSVANRRDRSWRLASIDDAQVVAGTVERRLGIHLCKQTRSVQQIVARRSPGAARAAAVANGCRGDRHSAIAQYRPGSRAWTIAPPVPISHCTSDRSLPRCIVHGTLRRVHGLDGAGVPAHGDVDGGANERIVEPRFRRRSTGAVSTSASMRASAAAASAVVMPARAGENVEPHRRDDRRGVVAHAEVAFDRALRVRLGQSVPDDAGRRRLAGADRVNVGRRTAGIDDERASRARRGRRRHRPAAARPRARRRVSASARGRPQPARGRCPSRARCGRMNTSRIAARAGSMSSTSNAGSTLAVAIAVRPALDSSVTIASVASRLPATTTGHATLHRASASALCRIDVAVAAIGAAAQQHDVGRERVDPRDVGRRQPIGESADELARRRRAPPGAPPRPSARGRARR